MKKTLPNSLEINQKFAFFSRVYIIHKDNIEECIYAGKMKKNIPYIYVLIDNQYVLMSVQDYIREGIWSWTFSAFDAMQALEIINDV